MLSLQNDIETLLNDIAGRRVLLLFPTQRSIRVFKEHTQLSPLPYCTTLDDLLQGLTNLSIPEVSHLRATLADEIERLKLDVSQGQNAYRLAEEVLTEFNNLDLSLANPKKSLEQFAEYKKLEMWSPDIEPSTNLEGLIVFWRALHKVYDAFNSRLLSKGEMYQGGLYREVLSQPLYMSSENFSMVAGRQVSDLIWVGFNALSPAEKKLANKLKEHLNCLFLWDADSFYLNNQKHEAGRFLRENKGLSGQSKWRVTENISNEPYKFKEVKCTGTHTMVAAAVNQFIASPKSKVLVVGDETLFPLILRELVLKDALDDVNMSLRMPLGQTPIGAVLLECVAIHREIQGRGYAALDSFRGLVSSLEVICSTIDEPNVTQWFRKQEETFNFRVFKPSGLPESLQSLFLLLKSNDVYRAVLGVLDWLEKHVDTESYLSDLMAYVRQKLCELEDVSESYQSFVLSDILTKDKVDVRTSSASDILITGLLETRLLSFQNVFFLSMVEGVIPSSSSVKGFIPLTVRNQLKMQTIQDKDAIFSYHFFRLLQYAKQVSFFYNVNEIGRGIEPSRYIRQIKTEVLKVNSNAEFSESMVEVPLHHQLEDTPKLSDTESIEDEVLTFLTERGVSASAVNKYLANPFDFYLRYIVGLKEDTQWEGFIASSDFGSVLHNILQKAYEVIQVPYSMDTEALKLIRGKAFELVDPLFDQYFGKLAKEGSIVLARRVAREMLTNIFQWEERQIEKHKTYRIIELERLMDVTVPLSNIEVNLKGFIDRIDEVNGELRVIDYKTGGVDQRELNFDENILNLFNSDKKGKALQLFFYAYLMYKSGEKVIQVGNLSLKDVTPEVYTLPSDCSKEDFDIFEDELSAWVAELLKKDNQFEWHQSSEKSFSLLG